MKTNFQKNRFNLKSIAFILLLSFTWLNSILFAQITPKIFVSTSKVNYCGYTQIRGTTSTSDGSATNNGQLFLQKKSGNNWDFVPNSTITPATTGMAYHWTVSVAGEYRVHGSFPGYSTIPNYDYGVIAEPEFVANTNLLVQRTANSSTQLVPVTNTSSTPNISQVINIYKDDSNYGIKNTSIGSSHYKLEIFNSNHTGANLGTVLNTNWIQNGSGTFSPQVIMPLNANTTGFFIIKLTTKNNNAVYCSATETAKVAFIKINEKFDFKIENAGIYKNRAEIYSQAVECGLYSKMEFNQQLGSYPLSISQYRLSILEYTSPLSAPNPISVTHPSYSGWRSSATLPSTAINIAQLNPFFGNNLFNNFSYFANKTYKITVEVKLTTGEIFSEFTYIKFTENPNGFAIYPNPASAYLQINLGLNDRSSNYLGKSSSSLINIEQFNIPTTIRIINMNGVVVKTIKETLRNNIEINVEDLQTGVYILQMGEQAHKFIKQ